MPGAQLLQATTGLVEDAGPRRNGRGRPHGDSVADPVRSRGEDDVRRRAPGVRAVVRLSVPLEVPGRAAGAEPDRAGGHGAAHSGDSEGGEEGGSGVHTRIPPLG
ncbi:hypothetical protein ACFT8V_15090 [Streptomyces griseoincarnatus]